MKKLPIHPLAELLPPMTAEEYLALKEDIARHGQREPAVLLEGKILDGRHRQDACAELGMHLATCKYLKSWGNPAWYVYSKAVHRNMSDSQKAAAAVGLLDEMAKDSRARSNGQLLRGGNLSPDAPPPAGLKSRDAAASLFGVSGRYVQEAKALRKGNRELFDQVFSGTLTLPRAKVQLTRHLRKKEIGHLVERVSLGKKDVFRLLVGDTVEQMRSLPAGCARVGFFDPPYNNGWAYDADKTGDSLVPDDYLAWCHQWMAAAVRLLDERGSIFVLIDDNYSDLLGVELRKLGLFRRRTIVWWEHFPNHTNGNFPAAARFIHYYTKAAKGFVWHPEAILVPSRRNELGDARGAHGGKVPDCVWAVTRKVGNATDRVPFDDAPPQIPVEIPERCILVASNPGDLVVDGFNGNGTTGVAALLNGRRYVGIDRSAKYAQQSEQWIKAQLAEHRGGRGK